MSDTLEIFGQEWTGVTGFKATDDNDQIKTFIRPQGTISISANGTGIDVSQYASADVAVSGGSNILIVTVSYNDQTEMWEPDCTYAEALVAAQSGKAVSVQVDVDSSEASADGDLAYFPAGEYPEFCELTYWVRKYEESDVQIIEQKYVFSQSGLNLAEEYTYTDGGGTPNLQTKSVSYTPSETAQSATVTADSGYDGLDEVSVSVGAISPTYVGSGITQRSSSDLTASGATVTVPSGYYASQATKSVTSGSATAPATISGTSATVSTGTNTLTLSKTVSVTPSVSAGYVSSGTAGNSSVSLQASVTTKAAATITPGTSNQTIASGTYLTGTQTISGDANLVAGNIKSGTSIFGVTGTYSGGGSDDVKTGTLTVASNVNTSASTQITTTTAIGFTPKVFIFYRSDRSATSNHVNQASFVTLGTSYYVRTMTRYSNNALSTSGNANNWTTQTAGYLYFNSNTIYFRSSSSYILPAGTFYWVAIK